ILALSENPVPDGSRRLSGNTVYHHIDISEHRIVYRVDKEKIYIAVIGNRNNDEVFKRLAKQNP
ncbi:MAG: type II toxin-antitoxin system RelE/ParE family toxin, partial [Deltaproteobacteria bacterium]|nr:type II toxin-antitoxin system RelE/ParE family toxin [Deltaproteobacteria bacterium]